MFTGRKNLYFKTENDYLMATALSIPLNKVNLKILSQAKSKTSGSSDHLLFKDSYLLFNLSFSDLRNLACHVV